MSGDLTDYTKGASMTSLRPRLAWDHLGMAPFGDDYGPIDIEATTYRGVKICRSRKRGTRTALMYVVGPVPGLRAEERIYFDAQHYALEYINRRVIP